MVGYHYVIGRDGKIERGGGKRWSVPTSVARTAARSASTGSAGWSGPNKGVDNRTPAQTESLIKLIRDLLKRYPGAQVLGHRDLAATHCPGFDVAAW